MFGQGPMKNKTRFYIYFIQSWHEKEKGEKLCVKLHRASQWPGLFLQITRKHSAGLYHALLCKKQAALFKTLFVLLLNSSK